MRKSLPIIMSIFLIFALTGSSGAQMQNRLQQQFEYDFQKTQEILQHARTTITASGNDQGTSILKLARQLQEEAHKQGHMDRHYEVGRRLTLESREKAKSAIHINQRVDENRNLVLRQLEKTDNLIHRISSHMGDHVPPAAINFFDTARKNQRRAWEFYRNNELRPALKLSRQAEKTVRSLIQRFNQSQADLKRLKNQMQQFQNNFERALAAIEKCENTEARQLMDKADEVFNSARESLDINKPKRAKNQIKKSRQLLRKALELCPQNGNLEKRIKLLENELRRINEIAVADGSTEVLDILYSARDHLSKAEAFCSQGSKEQCAAHLRAAEMSIENAKGILNSL